MTRAAPLKMIPALLLATALLSCGGDEHTPDLDAWHRAWVTERGFEPEEMDGYVDALLDICESDNRVFELTVALGLDDGDTADQWRLDIEHACPSRINQLEEALHVMGE